ncbi:valine--tRNA ligase [Cochlodiniinecator piscidefendens]|uniref:valine--tRNA ligase n=1 Tax=Cochlodiniinecator piscidefendens TaxID=2715756 RepID=UPI00140C646E|nr:valine--tRNA ligase [Cochlodiniinecator piscidefendens]
MAMEKTFDAGAAESRIYAKWEDAGAFKAGANAKDGKDTFSIMIPPPNVTGVLHVGHAFNNTIQDILIRWKRMQGFDTLWQPGQDHAGIATQLVVERKLAETGQPTRAEMGREKFLEKVMEWKEESGGTIIQQLKRLGASCDWSRNAFTMDENFHDAVIKVFVDMYDKGLIYRGKRLVNWDPHFETAISDLEVESTEVDGHMWHFKYPLAGGATYEYVEKDEDGNITLRETRDYISIATTRPETMLGDGAVAVHPSDERYAPIVGKLCEIPVGPKAQRRLIPIITDEYPDKDFGSGAVKITGAHDFNDYGVAKRNNIPLYALMDSTAKMRADGLPYAEAAALAQSIANGEAAPADTTPINLVPEEYRGLDRFDARAKVIAEISAEGLAVMCDVTKTDEDGAETTVSVPYVENKKIMQPFGDRSKVVIEPMLTDQWFVDTDKIVGPALDAVRDGRTKIMPESGEKVYYHWLDNIEPWCISRQLWWGHQIPVWYGPHIDEDGSLFNQIKSNPSGRDTTNDIAFCAHSAEAAAEKARKYYGSSHTVTATDNTSAKIGFNKTGGFEIGLYRDPDVLDTWFSSGLWPIGTLGWPNETPELAKYFPTDVLVTGQDILFFWVARMMMMQQAVVEQDPFHTVYLHQLVRDEKGEKMSKTRGNVIDPLEIVDVYGADALRFTMTQMAAMGGVLKLSEDRIKGYRNFGTKIWNASRFAEMNGVFEVERITDVADLNVTQTVNRWIIGETAKVREEIDAALEAYRFNDAANALYAFVWGKVCDWYVELSKPLFFSEDDLLIGETRQVMGWVLDQCYTLLHPIMPFITEELWENSAKRDTMLIHTDWPTYAAADLLDADADREMNWVIALIENVRSARQQMHVPAGLKIPVILQDLDDKGRVALENNMALIQKMARIDSITEMAELPKGCVTVAVDGGTFALPLAEIIDIDAEKARLDKNLGKLAKELGGLRGRLNNPKFVASAPDEVVEEARQNLAAREEEEDKLKLALARLAEIG